MKIEKLDKEIKKVDFEKLKAGDCYLDSDGVLCMKIDSILSKSDYEYNCICLENGYMTDEYGEVTLVEATVQYYIKRSE